MHIESVTAGLGPRMQKSHWAHLHKWLQYLIHSAATTFLQQQDTSDWLPGNVAKSVGLAISAREATE